MFDPVIEEFVRARELQPNFFRRVQCYLRDVVDVKLQRIDELEKDNANLLALLGEQSATPAKRRKAEAPDTV